MKNCLPLFRQKQPGQETATDLYLITLLGIFPLFPGFQGYANITFSKFLFFVSVTGLWLAALAALQWRERARFSRPTAAQWAALGFLLAVALSWLCSPWRAVSLLAEGRYDGAVTLAACVLCFLGVSRFTVPKPCHVAALAVGTGLCCLVGLFQILGLDPLGLFPGDLNYYDSGLRYSGVYLGTIGNTNILDAVLALSLPLCAACWICTGRRAWLPVFVPCVPVLARGGLALFQRRRIDLKPFSLARDLADGILILLLIRIEILPDGFPAKLQVCSAFPGEFFSSTS